MSSLPISHFDSTYPHFLPRVKTLSLTRAVLFLLLIPPLILVLTPHPPLSGTNFSLFPPPAEVTLLIVSDANHYTKYKSQAQSVQSYAQAHGYDFSHLDPVQETPLCVKNNVRFLFRKHCAVAQWLRTRPANSLAVVLDGDVIGGTSNQTLGRWLAYEFDVAFYERSWNFEVMSGNYMVRNTKFARMFLHHWASYESILPLGFSSDDNGAIHLAILEAIGIEGRDQCREMYRNLTAPVSDLGPYYEFVGCAKELLGPARLHVVRYPRYVDLLDVARDSKEEGRKVAGKILLFPRFFGFAVDAKVHGIMKWRGMYPFYHGVKEEDWEQEETRAVGAKEIGEKLRKSDEYALRIERGEYSRVPRWGHVDAECYARLWCEPLGERVAVWPTGYRSESGSLQEIGFEERNVDSENKFVMAMHEGGLTY
eukprot:GFKZ01001457.1.p1 GENE.GFKZ01001457.1~~GFKZ01001457.1.p1  ORF type:complete len:424 (-),score=44.77 GFKZ01001457.1:211-1482(-)